MTETKVCTKCGIQKDLSCFDKNKSKKDGLYCQCKECRKEYNKNYYQANRDKIIEYRKEYYEQNKERALEHKKDYYEQNKEKIAEKNRKYNQTERGKTVRRLLEHKRRTLKTSLSFKLSKADIEHMFDYFDNSCANCGSNNNLALDHFIALTDPSCPGTVAWNIIPLCRSCNSKKYNKKPEFFFEETIYIWIQRYLLNCEVGQASYYQECRNNDKETKNSN